MMPRRARRALRIGSFILDALSTSSCNRDHSITRGSNGPNDWDRRLKAAVPLGISVAQAQATLEHNGFTCHRDALGAQTLRCDKRSGRKFGFFRRRWQATVTVRDGQVSEVRGTAMFGRR